MENGIYRCEGADKSGKETRDENGKWKSENYLTERAEEWSKRKIFAVLKLIIFHIFHAQSYRKLIWLEKKTKSGQPLFVDESKNKWKILNKHLIHESMSKMMEGMWEILWNQFENLICLELGGFWGQKHHSIEMVKNSTLATFSYRAVLQSFASKFLYMLTVKILFFRWICAQRNFQRWISEKLFAQWFSEILLPFANTRLAVWEIENSGIKSFYSSTMRPRSLIFAIPHKKSINGKAFI